MSYDNLLLCDEPHSPGDGPHLPISECPETRAGVQYFDRPQKRILLALGRRAEARILWLMLEFHVPGRLGVITGDIGERRIAGSVIRTAVYPKLTHPRGKEKKRRRKNRRKKCAGLDRPSLSIPRLARDPPPFPHGDWRVRTPPSIATWQIPANSANSRKRGTFLGASTGPSYILDLMLAIITSAQCSLDAAGRCVYGGGAELSISPYLCVWSE